MEAFQAVNDRRLVETSLVAAHTVWRLWTGALKVWGW
jgi:hypothetical protein